MKGITYKFVRVLTRSFDINIKPGRYIIFIKNTLPNIIIVPALTLMISCNSTDSRVKKNQSAFDSWPVEVQEKVRAGKVEIGFTGEMVRVALGEPARIMKRTSNKGVSEVWVYEESGSGMSFGLGMGTMHRSNVFGGGISVGNDWHDKEILRIIYDGDKVITIESKK